MIYLKETLKKERLDELNEKILKAYEDKGIVLGDGDIDSAIMLIGEAPGSKEVEMKKPFVGQAGKHLDEFIRVLNIDRNQLYITNVVKFRPTKKSQKTGGLINRPPTAGEIEAFKEYLFEEIDIIKPNIIITLGNTPLKGIFCEELKIGDVHGKPLSTNILRNNYKVFPLYHPAAVIYRRQLKEVYIGDLKKLKDLIDKGIIY